MTFNISTADVALPYLDLYPMKALMCRSTGTSLGGMIGTRTQLDRVLGCGCLESNQNSTYNWRNIYSDQCQFQICVQHAWILYHLRAHHPYFFSIQRNCLMWQKVIFWPSEDIICIGIIHNVVHCTRLKILKTDMCEWKIHRKSLYRLLDVTADFNMLKFYMKIHLTWHGFLPQRCPRQKSRQLAPKCL